MTASDGGGRLVRIVGLAMAMGVCIVPAQATITYVDASPSNTVRADGAPLALVTASTGGNDQWVLRGSSNTVDGVPYANGGYVYQAIDAVGGDTPPELVTTLTAADGLVAGERYEVFAFFWDTSNTGQDWRLRAGLSSNPGGNTLFRAADVGSRNNEVMWAHKPAAVPAQPWTMADLFRRNGYRTVMAGKISHSPDGYHYDDGAATIPAVPANEEMPFSWDEIAVPPAFLSKWGTGWKSFFGYADGSARIVGVSPPMEIGDPGAAPAPLYPDIAIADTAVAKLRELQTNRFFLAVGVYKPHLPFAAPREYCDLYTNALPFSPDPETSVGVSTRTQVQSGEPTENYGHDPQPANWDDLVNTPYHADLRRAYFACVSFVDAQIGRVLDEVDALGLATNTVVVLWGDHGWHLGDHNLWGKHTEYERSARSAMIVRTPNMRFRGHATDALVESVDLYPTLAELCGLSNPPPPPGLSGVSMVPVLGDPLHPGKDEAIT